MVKLIVRYDDSSTQVFVGETRWQAAQRRREYEMKHPRLVVLWLRYE